MHKAQKVNHMTDRLKVEKMLGRSLDKKHHVHHHFNQDGTISLVICENALYHRLLHKKTNDFLEMILPNIYPLKRKKKYAKREFKISESYYTSIRELYHSSGAKFYRNKMKKARKAISNNVDNEQ